MDWTSLDYDQAVETLLREFSFDFVSIGLAPEPGAPLKWLHSAGATGERHKRIVLSPGQGIGGIVLKAGKPMMFTDIDHQLDPREYSSYPIVFAEDLRSFCALPLLRNAHVVGVLICAYRTSKPEHEAIFKQLMDTVKAGICDLSVNEDDFLTFKEIARRRNGAGASTEQQESSPSPSRRNGANNLPAEAASTHGGPAETRAAAAAGETSAPLDSTDIAYPGSIANKVATAASQAQERERKRISRELHDGVAQEVLSVSMLLKQLEIAHPDDQTKAIVHEAETNINRILGEIHNLSVQLRPLALDDLGLIAALRAQADLYCKTYGAEITLDDSTDGRRYNHEIETQAYRITQEALLNACKYSDSDAIGIVAADDGEALSIAVFDQGAGFDTKHPVIRGYGCGLSGMRERAALVGGTLNIFSGGSGTTVSLRIPHKGDA